MIFKRGFGVSGQGCATSYAWNFGDGATSNVQNPRHTYAANGTYMVTLTMNGSTTVQRTVVIGLPASSATIFGPAQVCLASGNPPFYNYSTNAQPGLAYKWGVAGGAISGFDNNDNVDVTWAALPGSVQFDSDRSGNRMFGKQNAHRGPELQSKSMRRASRGAREPVDIR